MRKFRYILCLYISVAVIMGAVAASINAEVFSFFGYDEGETAVSVTEDECIKEAVSDITEESSLASEDYIAEDGTQDVSGKNENVSDKAEEKESESFFEETSSYEDTKENTAEELIFVEGTEIEYHDAYAPGGKYEKASELLFLSDNIDSLATENSVNVYTFTVPERSVFSYTVTHDAPMTVEGWKISLYGEYYPDGDGKNKSYRLIDELNTTVFAVDSSPEIGLPQGEYRLVVTKGNAFDAKQYKITATLKKTSLYETECNDNIYRYTEIYGGAPLMGSASYFPDRQDEDYYLFRMYNDGFVELKFEHQALTDKPSVCWQVILLSEDGTIVYSVNSLFTDEINRSGKIGLVKGNYYILIKNRVYTDMTYTLTIGRTEDSDYENEKNDTPETADKLTFGTAIGGSVATQISGIDKDYFTFEVEKNGYCEIEFAHEPVSGSDSKNGWNIVLTDSKGNILYEGISAWADDVTVSSDIGLGKGTYYVRIDSENLYNNSEKYYLTVNFTEDASWETEYNNSFATADALISGKEIYGILAERESDYDYDYYVIELDKKSDITITFNHEKLSYHKEIFNFTVYDSNKNAVSCYFADGEGSAVIKSYSDEETVTAAYKELPAGKYYVRVSSGIFFDNIKYSITY